MRASTLIWLISNFGTLLALSPPGGDSNRTVGDRCVAPIRSENSLTGDAVPVHYRRIFDDDMSVAGDNGGVGFVRGTN